MILSSSKSDKKSNFTKWRYFVKILFMNKKSRIQDMGRKIRSDTVMGRKV